MRIGTVERETSVNTITNDYGEYASLLKDYKNYDSLLKQAKITDPTQWPSWAK